jgi:hypothetical protein
MAQYSVAFDTPDLAETIGFLRRFAELMSNGYNAAYLRRACELLETSAEGPLEAANAEALWRSKHERLTRRADVLQAECDALKQKVAFLESGRHQLRFVFDSINGRQQTIEAQPMAGRHVSASVSDKEVTPLQPRAGDGDQAAAEASAVVPKATLRQARAQFEYLADEFIPLGDIASQVMCELAAHSLGEALVAGEQKDHLAAGKVAQSVLVSCRPKQR